MRAFLLHSNEPALELLLDKLTIAHGSQLPSEQEAWFIIHWGAYHPERGHAEALQPVKSLLLSLQPARVAELLKMHGIDCALEEDPSAKGNPSSAARTNLTAAAAAPGKGRRWTHIYAVPVFHLQALSLFHQSFGVYYSSGAPSGVRIRDGAAAEWTELGTDRPTYYAAHAMREAVKTIYALGLDYGVVRVGVRPDGTMAVLRLEAIPQLTPRLAELFAEAMNRFDEQLASGVFSRHKEVMLGADPEFLLLTPGGKVKFASRYVDKDGPFGCDAIVLRSRRKIFPLAELRPKPSTEVRELLIHLHRTMQLAAKRITDSDLLWVAGGMPVRGLPLGGHIHFSGTPLDGRLLRALDNYIALPLTLLEDTTTGWRKPQYGFLGDFRKARHGGFEYRVLPSWMVSPTVAKGVLALAKLVAEHYLELKQRPLAEPEVTRAYYQGDKARIRPLLSALWRDVEKLPGYARHESYLLPLRRMMLQMRSWNEREDIRPKWKISPFA
ncbi:putative amidoligase domain-containing protein [Paenibacillus naphthalenovorans]|uniref:putative amidoligase domain-containing protein n=1 Tax=Paenibacillus naphthalenovorans TaxID=162209 RepID=UPI003D2E0165